MERRLRNLLPDGSFGDVTVADRERMQANRSHGSKSTERRARAILVKAGIRGWVLHPLGLVGRPDFYFPAPRLVVFVDGCYWHGCPRCGHVPTKNSAYWSAKIGGNRRRDRRYVRQLRRAGFRVLRVWEHELMEGIRGEWLVQVRACLARNKPPGICRGRRAGEAVTEPRVIQ
jgi:DNA mismatch endonuclease (patch repair protein)